MTNSVPPTLHLRSSFARRALLLAGLAALPALSLWASPARAADGLTVGFIYVGPKTDYGYNQAHAQGASVVAKLPGVKIREEEMVPETVAVQKTMESMINLDGAKVVFPTSFGYFDPHILKLAQKYKDVTFLHCGGLYVEGKHPANVGSYFGYIDEAEYISGIVAGLQQAGVHRRQAHPPGAPQHQFVHPGRALGEPQGDHHGHLHR
jgi:simple sugar transport system substrate-binding protein